MNTLQKLKAAAYTGLVLGVTPRQSHGAGTDLKGIIDTIVLPLLQSVVVVIFALALLWFIYGVAQYVGSDVGSKKAEAAANMGYSILAMFVMVSVWGLVRLLQDTLRLDNAAPKYPNFGSF